MKEFNDTREAVSFGNDRLNVIEMGRTVGLTTDHYRFKGPNSSHDLIQFTPFGQATIIQETDVKRTYVCHYQIYDHLLLLEINSMTTEEDGKEKKIKTFAPASKTFLKIDIHKELVRVENMDLTKVIDGTRNWQFRNQKFHIENMVLTENEILLEEFNRVVKQ